MAKSEYFNKRKKAESSTEEPVVASSTKNVRRAYDIFYDKDAKTYKKVIITYDTDSGTQESIEVVNLGNSQALASTDITKTFMAKFLKKSN